MKARVRAIKALTVIGTGAFVTRDQYGPGVVARSLAQWCSDAGGAANWLIRFVFRSTEGRTRIEREWQQIQQEIPNAPAIEMIEADSKTLDESLVQSEAAFIVVPDAAHGSWIERCIDAGLPVWVVKPLTSKGRESSRLVELAESRQASIWVDYHKRFDVSNRLVKADIETGRYGAPRLYNVRYSQPRDLPLDGFAWTPETDVFSYIGCHYVDQLLHLFPDLDVQDVSAKGVAGPVYAEFGGNTWDTVLARLDCSWQGRPLTAQFEVGWSNPLGSPTKSLQIVELAFDQGKLFLDQTHRGIEAWSDDGVAVPNPHFFSRISDPLRSDGTLAYQGYGYESVAHFLNWTQASRDQKKAALKNDALPWARSAAKVDAILDRVADAMTKSACP